MIRYGKRNLKANLVAWGHLPYGFARKFKYNWGNPVMNLKAKHIMSLNSRDAEDAFERMMFIANWSTSRRWQIVLVALIVFVPVTTASYALGFPQTVAIFLAVTYLLATCGMVGLPGAWLLGLLVYLTLAVNIILLNSNFYGELHVHNATELSVNAFTGAILLSEFVVIMIVSTVVGGVGMLLIRTHEEFVARRETDERYRLLVEETTDVAYITDLRGRFLYISPAVTRLIGYKPEEVIGKRFAKLVQPKWRKATLAFYVEQYRSGLSETIFLLPIVRQDGEIRWIEQTVVLRKHDDEIVGFHALARDVTDRKQVEDELQAARDKAVMASRFKSQLLANVSHDLRTPLSSIMLISEMLQKGYYGDVSEEQEERLQIIRDSGSMLQLLIKNLLDEAQLEAGKLELQMGAFSPDNFLGITSVLKPLVEQRGLAWEEEIADNLPPVLYGDVERLKQVLSNLVTNAAKFTRKGKVKLRVYQPDKSHWAFEVSDTGKGIAQNVLPHVFQPFWQEDGSTTRDTQSGVGLGLSIVKQLTTSMNGEIIVDSVEGEGTTFTLTFPIPQIYRQPKQDAEQKASEQAPHLDADENRTEVSNRAGSFVAEDVRASNEESDRNPLSQSSEGASMQDESAADAILANAESDDKEETADDSNEAETKAPTTTPFSATESGSSKPADAQTVGPNEEPTQLPKPGDGKPLSA